MVEQIFQTQYLMLDAWTNPIFQGEGRTETTNTRCDRVSFWHDGREIARRYNKMGHQLILISGNLQDDSHYFWDWTLRICEGEGYANVTVVNVDVGDHSENMEELLYRQELDRDIVLAARVNSDEFVEAAEIHEAALERLFTYAEFFNLVEHWPLPPYRPSFARDHCILVGFHCKYGKKHPRAVAVEVGLARTKDFRTRLRELLGDGKAIVATNFYWFVLRDEEAAAIAKLTGMVTRAVVLSDLVSKEPCRE